jgi:hypothetical protein
MIWYVLINAAGDPASISSAPVPNPPNGWSVKEFTADGQPDVAEWWDPVSGGTLTAARRWDRGTASWTTIITPTVVDRVLDDLANDAVLVAVWQRLTVAQRDVLRSRLALLLGRRRYRYANDPVDLED